MISVLWFSRATAGPEPQRSARRRGLVALLALLVAAAGAPAEEGERGGVTPPRVGLVDGEVSFWRPGASDWEAARVNIPLAPGDALATNDGMVEVQIGARSFVRVGRESRLQVKSLEPDFLQLEVSEGQAVLDLRDLPRGHGVEVDTPGAVVSVARDGYYRIDVTRDATRVVARRGGRAAVTPAGGHEAQIATGEALLVEGAQDTRVSAVAAPDLDAWDHWNYERAEQRLAGVPSRGLPPEMYGADELERNGSWRVVETYGRVWVPYAVPVGWVPYSTGVWLRDPYWGWTWVDDAPWGWAPFHYGRWVYAGGYWAWAPGPVYVAPVYAPALVAFFGGGGFSIGVGVPFVSWVALGWGEPLIPWWGPVGFVGAPCWWGWGGPRTVIVNNTTVVNYGTNLYRNAKAPNAIVGVPKERFHEPVARHRLAGLTHRDVKPAPDLVELTRGAARPAVDKAPPRHAPDVRSLTETRGASAGKSSDRASAPASVSRGGGQGPPAKAEPMPRAFERPRTEQGAVGGVPERKPVAEPLRSYPRDSAPPQRPAKPGTLREPQGRSAETWRALPRGAERPPNRAKSDVIRRFEQEPARAVPPARSYARDAQPPPRAAKPGVVRMPERRQMDAASVPGPARDSRHVVRMPERRQVAPAKPPVPMRDPRSVMRDRATRLEPAPPRVAPAPLPERRSLSRGSGGGTTPRAIERAAPSTVPAKRGLALSLPGRGSGTGTGK